MNEKIVSKNQNIFFYFEKIVLVKKKYLIIIISTKMSLKRGLEYLLLGGKNEIGIAGRQYCILQQKHRLTFPFNCIGRLLIQFQEGQPYYQGTGFLISQTLVITVAHNLFQKQRNLKACKLIFILYQEGGGIEKYDIEDQRYNERYVQSLSELDEHIYDYAMLKLSKPVKSRNIFLKIQPNFGLNKQLSDLSDTTLLVYGYPVIQGTNLAGCQFKKAIKQLNQQFLLSLLPTKGGHSGSPIIIKDQDGYHVVGIHQKGQRGDHISQNFNQVRLFTKDLYDVSGQIALDLTKWSQQMDPIDLEKSKTNKSLKKSVYLFMNIKINNEMSRLNQTQAYLSFWDRNYKDFSYFSIKNKVVLLDPVKQESGGWKRLFTTKPISSYILQTVHIKDINLVKHGKICVGFVSKQFKDNNQGHISRYFDHNFLGMMISTVGQFLNCEIRACGSLKQNQNIKIKPTEELFLNFRLSNSTDNKLKNNEKGSRLMQLDLNKNSFYFDINASYFFYVAMFAPGTSVKIDL